MRYFGEGREGETWGVFGRVGGFGVLGVCRIDGRASRPGVTLRN